MAKRKLEVPDWVCDLIAAHLVGMDEERWLLAAIAAKLCADDGSTLADDRYAEAVLQSYWGGVDDDA